jgi:hypothetical protein
MALGSKSDVGSSDAADSDVVVTITLAMIALASFKSSSSGLDQVGSFLDIE